jgi:hypothetical protein
MMNIRFNSVVVVVVNVFHIRKNREFRKRNMGEDKINKGENQRTWQHCRKFYWHLSHKRRRDMKEEIKKERKLKGTIMEGMIMSCNHCRCLYWEKREKE